jgi:aryl-alcohol dehydrogenase-like predicted oxidoreductase
MTLERLPFGRTGHQSSRLIFGAAALMPASQPEADRALELLLEAGVNHIDVAAMEQLDLIQLHNLVKPDEWEQALGNEGALRAALEARDEGRVRFIGVTGHGTRVAEMHLRSLERHDFDSVLLPYNHSMMSQSEYADDFERLLEVCRERQVAVQTIKSIARRRWREGETPTHSTWYAPLTDPADVRRAVQWALARPGVFVNSASDLSLLPHALEAARDFGAAPEEADMRGANDRLEIQPLFVRGYDGVRA